MTLTINYCSTCDFYLAGECRLNPPTFYGGKAQQWPKVSADDWCGSHPANLAQEPTYQVTPV